MGPEEGRGAMAAGTSIPDGVQDAAAAVVWPARVAEFTRWVGEGPASGRKLTQAGRLTMADARALVERLGTGDVIDPVIGDQTFRTKSSEELTELQAALAWARAVGLVRRRGNALVAVKKHAGLVDRPADLLVRMVTSLGDLGPAVCPSGWGQSILRDDFAIGAQMLLTMMDLDPDGVDVEAVSDRLWARLSPLYRTGDLTAQQRDGWRRCLARDVWRTVELLAETGLVTVDLTVDVEQRRSGRVPVTALGRWVLRRIHGGPDAGEPVLQLRIELVDSADPLVWRQVLVPAGYSLADLHVVIQAAMGWQDSHLHLFRIGDTLYGRGGAGLDLAPEDGVRLDRFVATGPGTGADPGTGAGAGGGAGIEAGTAPTALEYVYDLGDSWEHEVVVEAVTAADPDSRYPRCIGGEGACPPEDCGGTPGYEQLRETLADPSAPDREDLLAWLGEMGLADFDPARFDPHDADFRLAAMTWAARPR